MLSFKHLGIPMAVLAFCAGTASAKLVLDDSGATPCPQAPAKIRVPLPTDTDWFTDADDLKDTTPSYGKHNIDQLPEPKRNFCGRSDADIVGELADHPLFSGALAFSNPDGPFKTGSCWAHSRFQRSISYLGDFHPEKPKPTGPEADKIIDDLVKMKHVVSIPGYSSIREFSYAYKDKIKSRIESWYVGCLFTLDCTRRAGDVSTESPEAMKGRMDHLYGRMWPIPQLQFLRLRAKSQGLTDSHSWLLVGMERTHAEPAPNNPLSALNPTGYTLKFIDPNDPANVQSVTYHYGDRTLKVGKDEVLPYEDYDGDLVDLRKAIGNYCATPEKKK